MGVVTLAAAAVFAAWEVTSYDAKAWRADYEHLKRELAQRYANLDWVVSHRRLDLRKLDAQTSAAIDGAYVRTRAVLALERFVAAFDDPHLRLVPGERSEPAAPRPTDEPAREPVIPSCEADGYSSVNTAFKAPFHRIQGWRALRGGYFPTGHARDLGVLRIASFREQDYLAACRAVFRAGLTARALQLAVRAKLQDELGVALGELTSRGVRRLLVDVSGNGGGSEWVDDVVTLFTDRKLTRAAARLAAPDCDRSAIWRGERVCPVLGRAGEPRQLVGTGAWTGPLVVLVDHRTASAAEDLVVWLRENGVAKIAGQRTAGAGCGYVDGGGRITLQAGPYDVMAPNCARFLSDGTNEIEGIKPDLELAEGEVRDLERVLSE